MKKILWLPLIGLGLVGYWFQKKLCRHDYLRRTASNHLYLECTKCGKRTPGWYIDVASSYRQP